MRNDSDRSRPDGSASAEEEAWQGMPLELEVRKLPAVPAPAAGEETLERPRSELLPPLGARRQLLSHWLLWAGAAAALMAGLSMTLLVAAGATVGWQAPLLVFDFAVLLVVLGAFLHDYVSAGRVCRWTLYTAGIVACALVLETAVGRAALSYINGDTVYGFLGRLFLFGLLGLGGCTVYVQAFAGRAWARRAAAMVAPAYVLLALYRFLQGGGPVTAAVGMLTPLPAAAWQGLGVLAVGLAVCVAAARRSGGLRSRPGRTLVRAVPAVMALAAAGYVAHVLARQSGPLGAARSAWALGAGVLALAAVPVAVVGAVLSWRTGRSLRRDALDATRYLWLLVALAVVAGTAVWLPAARTVQPLQTALVGFGLLALAAVGWLGAGRHLWAARWVLVPAVGVTAALLCGHPALLEFARQVGFAGNAAWEAGLATAWCTLLAGLVLACGGLVERRRRARQVDRRRTLLADANLLGAVGVALCGGALALSFAKAVGNQAVVADIRAATGVAGSFGLDLAAQMAIDPLSPVAGLAAALPGGTAGIATGVLAVLLGLHLAVLMRARWSLYSAAALWAVPLAAVAGAVALYGGGVFLASQPGRSTTHLGRYLAAYPGARILLALLAAAATWRLAQAAHSCAVLARLDGLLVRRNGSAEADGPNLRFIVRTGVLVSAVGLLLALFWWDDPWTEANLLTLGSVWTAWLGDLARVGTRIGVLTSQSPVCAGAAAIILLLMLAVHSELMAGRLGVYGLAAAVWSAFLASQALHWLMLASRRSHPVRAGEAVALGLTGLLLAILIGACVDLWRRWWLQRATAGEHERASYAPEERSPDSASESLGALGLLLVLALLVAALHGVLLSSLSYRNWFPQAVAAGRRQVVEMLARVEMARITVAPWRLGWVAAAVVGAVSAALLALHYLARRMGHDTRLVVMVLWSLATFLGAAAALYMLGLPAGRWNGVRIALWLGLVGATVRIGLAVCSAALEEARAERVEV